MQASQCDELTQLNKVDALIMSRSLLDALREIGIDNLDVYPAIISHPKTGFVTKDYVACNLIGLVSAADIGKSKIVGGARDHRVDVDFDGVTIDESRVHDLLMFRLSENSSAVVVHERVRAHLTQRGFDQLLFLDPKKWIG